jgi:hypothetical protein
MAGHFEVVFVERFNVDALAVGGNNNLDRILVC